MFPKSLFASILSLSSIIAIASSADAAARCGQVSNPKPGDTCTQRVSVEARHVGYGDGISRGASESTSFAGWYITGLDGPTPTSNNNGQATIEFVQRGSDFDIARVTNEYDRNLENLRTQVQSYASFPISGVPVTVGGLTEKIDQSLRENESRRSYYSRARTNVDHIVVRAEASGRCTRNVFGSCVDSVGGWYQGYVDVHMVYVGSPNEISTLQQNTLSEIQRGLQQLEQARSNSNNNNNNVATGGSGSGTGVSGSNSSSDGVLLRNQWSNLCLQAQSGENGGSVTIGDCSSAANQLWTLMANGELRNSSSGKCLQTMGQDRENGSLVSVWDCTGTTNQFWQRTDNGEFRNQWSGRCLQTMGQDQESGSPTSIWDCTGTTNQFWR